MQPLWKLQKSTFTQCGKIKNELFLGKLFSELNLHIYRFFKRFLSCTNIGWKIKTFLLFSKFFSNWIYSMIMKKLVLWKTNFHTVIIDVQNAKFSWDQLMYVSNCWLISRIFVQGLAIVYCNCHFFGFFTYCATH